MVKIKISPQSTEGTEKTKTELLDRKTRMPIFGFDAVI